jgi:hypothetical protein
MDDKSKKSSTRSSTTTASQGSSSIINKANTNVSSKNVAAATSSSTTTTTKNSTSSIQHMTTNENEYDDDFYLNNDDDEDIIDDYDDDDDYVNGDDDDDDEDFNMEEDDDEDDQSKIQKASIDSNHNKNVSAITVTTNRSVSNAINLPPINKTTASHVSTSLSASLMAPKSNHKDADGVGCTSSSLSSQRAAAAAGYLSNRKRNVELDDEFKYEVLTPDKIVNHMIDCIKEVNQVLELPPTTTRILLHHFRWDKEKLMERFYDGDQDRLFKEAHIVSPFKSVNSGGPSTSTVAATISSSSSKKVGC